MRRETAMRCFWPFLLATSVAAAAEVGLEAFVETTLTPASGLPPRNGSPERVARTQPRHVSIEPNRIEVIGRHSAAGLEAGVDPSPRRRQPG